MYRLRIQEVAKAKGISQMRLVRDADLATRTIQKLWHNPTTDVQLSTLDRIADVLGVPLTDLIEVPTNQATDTPSADDKGS